MSATKARSGIVWGAGAGGLAYVLGYVVTYLASSSAIEGSGLNQLLEAFGGGGAVPRIIGWVFYNAHFASATIDVDLPVVGGSSTVNLIAETADLSPLLYLLPPAILIAAGLAAVRSTGGTELAEALRIGPAVAIGYLPLAVIGAFAFTVSAGGSSGQPTLVPAVVLVGLVYPIVFGTVGAAVGTALGGGG